VHEPNRNDAIQLRTATGSDEDFVNTLTRRVMRKYVESTWKHSEDQKRYYALNCFKQATTKIIQCNGKDIGRMTVRNATNRIILDGIHLTEAFQGQGIGRYLIKQLIDDAAARQLPLELILLKSNPVITLYEHLGFHTYKADKNRFYMRIVDPGSTGSARQTP